MRKKIVVYSHGYASSGMGDKARRLAEHFETYSWDIDIDPSVSLPALRHKLDFVLDAQKREAIDLVFVGTSLGGWFASKLAHSYGVAAVLINPAIDPSETLKKRNVSQEIRRHYANLGPISFRPIDKVFIGTEDEVLDFSGVDFSPASVEYAEAGHRFNGVEFDLTINYLKELRGLVRSHYLLGGA